jgi:hypothetical protein
MTVGFFAEGVRSIVSEHIIYRWCIGQTAKHGTVLEWNICTSVLGGVILYKSLGTLHFRGRSKQGKLSFRKHTIRIPAGTIYPHFIIFLGRRTRMGAAMNTWETGRSSTSGRAVKDVCFHYDTENRHDTHRPWLSWRVKSVGSRSLHVIAMAGI